MFLQFDILRENALIAPQLCYDVTEDAVNYATVLNKMMTLADVLCLPEINVSHLYPPLLCIQGLLLIVFQKIQLFKAEAQNANQGG